MPPLLSSVQMDIQFITMEEHSIGQKRLSTIILRQLVLLLKD